MGSQISAGASTAWKGNDVMSIADWQRALAARGFDPGKADGAWGPRTEAASFAALDRLSSAERIVPAEWMPAATMTRVVVHWTAGTSTASQSDREHYHILINGDGALVRGIPSIALNSGALKPGYAAHTLNCNTGSVGVSLAGMAGAQESPFDAGKHPITATQWAKLGLVIADLCERYGIAITKTTVLTHAEVQANLGITQKGKWDIAALPFDPTFPRTAAAVGDRMRKEATAALAQR